MYETTDVLIARVEIIFIILVDVAFFSLPIIRFWGSKNAEKEGYTEIANEFRGDAVALLVGWILMQMFFILFIISATLPLALYDSTPTWL